jgi:hypothetical protein
LVKLSVGIVRQKKKNNNNKEEEEDEMGPITHG